MEEKFKFKINTPESYNRVLKIIAISTFLSFFCVSSIVRAEDMNQQEKTLSLDLKNVTIKHVLSQIEKASDYVFLITDESKNELNKRINVYTNKKPIDKILKLVLNNTNLAYNVVGKQVSIFKKDESSKINSELIQQKKRTITGSVTDEKGEILVGVTVKEIGTNTGTVTDVNGFYRIVLTKKNPILEFSYIGFETQKTTLKKNNILNIVMKENVSELDEVVVVGYGQQKKESVVISMSSVKPSDITVPTRNLTNSLAGQVAGLIAVQRSGEPGYDNAEFWIRGVSTFAGGTSPLVLVDGVPRSMNDIEPDEIETFSVLKDAAATAVYGAQGANGVVLITTKRGKVEKAKISFRTEHSFSKPTRLPQLVGSVQYMELYNEAKRNDGEAPLFSEELIEKYRNNVDPDLYPNSNWLDLMLRDYTTNHRYTLSVKGGTEKARYFVSGAYYNESGLFSQNPTKQYDTSIGLNRFNLRSNIDMDISSTTTVNVDVAGQYLINTYPGTATSQLFRWMMITPPHAFPAFYSNGAISTYSQERDSNMRNPWNLLMHSGYAKEWRSSFQSNIGVSQKLDFITEGLRFKGSISYDYDGMTYWRRKFNPTRYHATGRDADGNLILSQTASGDPDLKDPSTSTNSQKNIYIEANLAYSHNFGEHKVGGMLLYNQREAHASGDALPYRKQGIVGRVTYGYNDRYFVEANFGYTGSETFAAGYRYGFFPAVGLAYYISNEPFYPEILKGYLDKVKLRASIGRSGNDNTGGERFLYRPVFKTDGGGFDQGLGDNGGLNGMGGGIFQKRLPAPYLSWEIENKRNYGIELGLWKNQIQIVLDYFDNQRTGILLQRRTLPQVSGFRDDPWQNYGIVNNHGIDASLDATKNFGAFSVGVRSTFTFARNKIVEYDELPKRYPWMAVTGTRVSENNVYIADRLYTNEDFYATKNPNGTYSYRLKEYLPQPTLGGLLGPGDIKYKDVNGDGVLDNYDMVRGVGNPETPEIIYGFGLSLKYKGLYANVFFQGAENTSVRFGGHESQGWFPFSWGVDQSNFRKFALNRWTEENPSQDVLMPRLHTVNNRNANNSVPSTWWLRDGSFLRFKNMEIGYYLPKSILKHISFSDARIYLMGYNIAVWDSIEYFDPEAGNGNAGLNYPLPRTFSLGCEFTF